MATVRKLRGGDFALHVNESELKSIQDGVRLLSESLAASMSEVPDAFQTIVQTHIKSLETSLSELLEGLDEE